jgi:hypothetical protein
LIRDDQIRVRFLRYIAAALSESENEQFEQRLLADQEFSDATAACEQELIDDYAAGGLSSDDARTLQPWIESSPRRMQRIATARALQHRSRPKRWGARKPLPILLVAACLLVIAGGLLHLAGRKRQTRPSAMELAKNAAPPISTPAQRRGLGDNPSVVLLMDERTRGKDSVPVYRIKPHAPIELQVLLAGKVARNEFGLELNSNDGRRIATWKGLKPTSKHGWAYLSVDLPADSLPPAFYQTVVREGGAGTSTIAFEIR